MLPRQLCIRTRKGVEWLLRGSKDLPIRRGVVCYSDSVKSQFLILSEKFHKPGDNHLTEGYVVTPKTEELLKKHLEETGGKVITRFPPEPNGFLHIGHAMAMSFNFSYAQAHGGNTYLRYDDTNPETIQEEYIRDIRENVEWLGFSPAKVTYASDYFPQLYDYGKELISRGHAYVCHQEKQHASGYYSDHTKSFVPSNQQDGQLQPVSPWRERPIQESLELFEAMRSGHFTEGEATLRMKIRLLDGKQDPVAYRVKVHPHPRTGTQWSVYPTYDFAHCLCDSIENITHSFCSKEFMIKRWSYYWLCNVLDVYCPVQWEFSRLNVGQILLSKRKIQKLLGEGIIKDWDDPRLYTLSGLRRRGIPPEAIREFCEKYGVLQSEGLVDVKLIDHYVRKHLNKQANRVMAVIDPIRVVITNSSWKEDHLVEVPNQNMDTAAGKRQVPFGKVIYIERSDFREDCPPDYKRLTPKQSVGLSHARCSITVDKIIKEPTSGTVVELQVTCHPHDNSGCTLDGKHKPKAYIHWLNQYIPCTIRFYEERSSNEVAKDSMKEVKTAFIEDWVQSGLPGATFQFVRIGYFCLDKDSKPDNLIFNQTISLRSKSQNKWAVVPDYFQREQ